MAIRQNDTPDVLKVGLTTFATYITAPSGKRIDCVRGQIRTYDQDYRPGPSYYQDFLDAVRRGRKSGADELAMQRVIVAQSEGARRDHYKELAEHWLAMSELQLPPVSHGATIWRTPYLSVSIRPDLALKAEDGNIWVVKLWPKDETLNRDAVRSSL